MHKFKRGDTVKVRYSVGKKLSNDGHFSFFDRYRKPGHLGRVLKVYDDETVIVTHGKNKALYHQTEIILISAKKVDIRDEEALTQFSASNNNSKPWRVF